jgi:glycosyltransferase involved in cell wall biosynthesis
LRIIYKLLRSEINRILCPMSDYIIKNRTVHLSEPTPEAMDEKVVRLLIDKALLERLSRNALAWAGEFDWDRSAEEFFKVVACV